MDEDFFAVVDAGGCTAVRVTVVNCVLGMYISTTEVIVLNLVEVWTLYSVVALSEVTVAFLAFVWVSLRVRVTVSVWKYSTGTTLVVVLVVVRYTPTVIGVDHWDVLGLFDESWAQCGSLLEDLGRIAEAWRWRLLAASGAPYS